MKKVYKGTARKLFAEGKDIALLPCLMNPASMWAAPYLMNPNDGFVEQVNGFEYYNCNTQVGRYAAFYLVED